MPRIPTLTVEFISVHEKNMEKPNPPHRNPSADSEMISGRRKVIAHRASDFSKNVRRQSSAPTSENGTAEGYSSSNKAQPKLNLSKVLSDMRQVAREMAELNNEQKFDRRKMPVHPENLKAPNIESTPDIEAYKLPNGYQRICRTEADGKKRCMSKEPDNDSIWNAKLYLADPQADANSGNEFAKRLEEAIGKH